MELKQKIEKEIEQLDNERAQILQDLCVNERIFLPEIILQLVNRARAITRTIISLKGILGNIENNGERFKSD